MRNRLCVPFVIAVAVLAEACASAAPRLPVSSMAAREVQTRFFEHVDANTAMKAVVDMLQDGQFSIDRTDATLGLVVGTRSTSKAPSGEEKALKWISIGFTYGLAAFLPWSKSETVQIEASANVTSTGDGSRVRVTLLRRVLDGNGRIKKAEALTDGVLYQDLFELLGRSLFVAEGQ